MKDVVVEQLLDVQKQSKKHIEETSSTLKELLEKGHETILKANEDSRTILK